MARRTAIKIGSLNLLLLIIAVCLSVLSVLSFVTARAANNLTERQSQYVQETYAEEIAAQHFVALVDTDLGPVRDGKLTASQALANIEAHLSQYEADCIETEEAEAYGVTSDAEILSLARIIKTLRLNSGVDDGDYPKSGDYLIINSSDEEMNEPEAETGFYGSLGSFASSRNAEGDLTDAESVTEVIEVDANDTASDRTFITPKSIVLLEDISSTCIGGVQAIFTSSSGRILDCLVGVREDGTYVILRWQSSQMWIAEGNDMLWAGN